eukprot:360073-Chlamydomonas_euryale.AAC.2
MGGNGATVKKGKEAKGKQASHRLPGSTPACVAPPLRLTATLQGSSASPATTRSPPHFRSPPHKRGVHTCARDTAAMGTAASSCNAMRTHTGGGELNMKSPSDCGSVGPPRGRVVRVWDGEQRG